MKKTLLLLSSIFLTFSFSFAQISLLSTDMTSVGDLVVRYVDTIPAFGPGGAGVNQTWNFSMAVIDTVNNTSVVTTASTPYASTFQGATYAMTNDNQSYLYFTHTGGSMATNGAAGDLLGTGEIIEAPFSDALTLHVFPRIYGSHFDDTYAFQAEADGAPWGVERIRLTHTGHVYDTTDAYGTLITPTGTYDALRVKSTDYTTDVIEVQLFPFPAIFTQFATVQDTSVSYTWHAKEEMLAIAEFTYDSVGNPARFVYSTVPPVTTVGINESDNSQFSVYPQPAADQLCFNGIDNNSASRSIEIFSCTGAMVKRETLNSSCVEVSDLNPGMYILRIIHSDGILEQIEKFLID